MVTIFSLTKTKALSLILRNRALDDQTIIPPVYSRSKAHIMSARSIKYIKLLTPL